MANPRYCSTGLILKNKLSALWDKVEVDKLWDKAEELMDTGVTDSLEMWRLKEAFGELGRMWEKHVQMCVQCCNEESRILTPIVGRLARNSKLLMN